MEKDKGATYQNLLARPAGVLLMRKIEDKASERFLGLGLIEDENTDSSFPLDDLARPVVKDQVWVVCQGDDTPVGMVIASERDGPRQARARVAASRARLFVGQGTKVHRGRTVDIP